VKSYGQYCPVAKAAEIVGQRWTLLIVRELLFGPAGFNEVARGLPGISRSLLADRLRRMTELGIIERRDGRYRLTRAGVQLAKAMQTLGDWAASWILEDPKPAELDPELLGLWMSRHVAADELPSRRVVVDFDLRGPKPGRLWLVLERGSEPSICLTDPCLDEDAYLYVQAETRELYRVYMGRADLSSALSSGDIQLSGAPALVRQFRTWFTWSSFAPAVRAATAQRAAAAQRRAS
jgi:DNA-binding HxlR family transcriptional regulator